MNLNIFAPLTKVDPAQRLVYLTMTAERPDRTREIMDYATGKPQIQQWSDGIRKASDGKSLGNVRLMHGKEAIGKLTDIVFDDAAKSIECVVKVVDDAAWKLVDERVLTGGSIGGAYAKKWPDPDDRSLTRYTPLISEFSLVDNPCLPEATFKLVKSDGTTEDLEFAKIVQAYEPGRDATLALAEDLAKAAGKPGRRNDYVVRARADLIKRHANRAASEPDPVDALAEALAKADSKNPPKPYGDVEYADPKTGKYPIDTPAHIRAAWSYVNMPKNAAALSDADAVKARIVAAWKAKISTDGPPSAEKAALITDMVKSGQALAMLKGIHAVAMAKGFYTVQRVAGLMNQMSDIASGVVWEEAYEQDSDSTLPQGILDLIASTRSYLIDMINEETAEFMHDCERDGGDSIALLAPCMDVDGMSMEMATRLGDLHKADAPLMAKVGRRMSAADAKHVQAMHDHSMSLGAKCDSGNCEKAAGPRMDRLEKALADAIPRIKKIAGERDAALAKAATLEADVSDLRKRLDAIERLPRDPKGSLFAIEKDGAIIPISKAAASEESRGGPADVSSLPTAAQRGAALMRLAGGGYAPGAGAR